MQPGPQDSAPLGAAPGDAVPPAQPPVGPPAATAQPLPLVTPVRPARPLLQAVSAWIVAQLTSAKALGSIAAAAIALVGGSLSIEYLRGVLWPPVLGAEAELLPETLEIRAWNLGARDGSLRNVTLTVREDGVSTPWPADEIDWHDPKDFADRGLPLPRDGHDSEFVRLRGKALPSAVFYEFGRQCTYHLDATFARQAVRIPAKGECPCEDLCAL